MEVALLLTIYPIPFRIIFVRTSCINNIVFRDDFFKFGKGIGKRMVLIVVSVEKKKWREIRRIGGIGRLFSAATNSLNNYLRHCYV